MSWTIYRNSDAEAPVLTTTAGSLVALLDACLVNGYGSKPSAGWSKAFSDTHKAVYRPGPAAASRKFFRINDAATGSGGASEALIRGFDSMSDVDTGSLPFPSDTQSSLTEKSLVIRKVASPEWLVAADDRTCILFIKLDANFWTTTYFGEYLSYRSADAHNCALIARRAENAATAASDMILFLTISKSALAGSPTAGYDNEGISVVPAADGHFVSTNLLGTAGSLKVTKVSSGLVAAMDSSWISSDRYNAFDGVFSLPDAYSGRVILCPMILAGATGGIDYCLFGELRGLFLPAHPGSLFTQGDTLNGGGDLAGRSFLCMKYLATGKHVTGSAATAGTPVFLETTQPNLNA